MGSIIDPITGLPYDALDTTLYSIPLDSQPSLAPEWNPQGRISSTVYPDNIPTVFATGQAQNELNPKNVQAMTTDGAGNLNVNVKAGGGGGGAATVPTIWYGDAQIIDGTVFTYPLPTPISRVYYLTGTIHVYKIKTPGPAWVNIILADEGAGLGFPLFRAYFPAASAFTGYVPFPIPFIASWPDGLNVSYAFDGASTQAVFLNASICTIAVTWGLVCS